MKLDGTEAVVSASIGITVYPHDGQTIAEFIRNADTAMYRAKADGKATFRFFEHQMNEALQARHALESRLRKAVADRQLSIAYQPLVDCRTRRPEGFEALLRWWDATLGDVPPSEFIPIAKETGLIISLGEFALRQACEDASSWPEPLRVAVNLSPVQFRRPGLSETVAGILEETGLSGSPLELEITESILIENRDQILETLRALKDLGVHISMDDFGTGYSSLSYLQSFPFDKIKIDRTFVSSLTDRSQSAHIIKAITAMGRSLDMKVVAEGVETEEHLHEISQLSCDEVQGYYIARSIDPALFKNRELRLTLARRIRPDRGEGVAGLISNPARRLPGELGMELGEGFAGGGSDGNTTSLFTTTLDGLGPLGDGAHAPHECLYLDETLERTALLSLLLPAPPLEHPVP